MANKSHAARAKMPLGGFLSEINRKFTAMLGKIHCLPQKNMI
jgi:hypothetical protein